MDRAVIGDLYRAESERMLVYFARRVYDAQLALDLVAETFARAYESRDRVAGEDGAAWVWGIARNVLHDTYRRGSAERRALRRMGAQRVELSDDECRRIEELAGLEDLRALVLAALEELTPDQRAAVQLRVVDELAYPQVAERLGVSEATARARVSRGLRVLAVALDGAEGLA
jgi:RNA polymerase sigma-70 factor (ECF subfamily)